MFKQIVARFIKPSARVGIDIGSSSIKMLELREMGEGQYRIENYAVAFLPHGAIVEKKIKEQSAIIEAIRQNLHISRTKAKKAIIAVPDSSVITKIIQISSDLKKNEQEEMVMIEAAKHIPYPIEEVNLDFAIKGPSPKRKGYNDVLLVASRSEEINMRCNVVAEAGLEVEVVDVEVYAIERACSLFRQSFAKKIIAVVDVGTTSMSLTILKNMSTIFSREEQMGEQDLFQAIEKKYHMDHEDVVSAVQNKQLPKEVEVDIIKPFIEHLIIQINRALKYFHSSSHHAKVEHLLLSGSMATLSGLDESLSQSIDMSVSVFTPIGSMSVSKKVNIEQLEKNASSLMVCCGLAMQKIRETPLC